jgi:hypothetical protein
MPCPYFSLCLWSHALTMGKKLLSVSVGDVGIISLAGVASGIVTKQLPQLILSTSNAGVEGYAANLATGLAVTLLASRFLGPKAGTGALVGALVVLLDRILSDQFSTLAPYLGLSGVSDGRIGTIQYFPTYPQLAASQAVQQSRA